MNPKIGCAGREAPDIKRCKELRLRGSKSRLGLRKFLHWHTRGPIEHEHYFPKGDLNLLREYCYVGQSGPYPVGLFVPMEVGWIAVKDFLEKDGVRSPRIQWISAYDLPPNTRTDVQFAAFLRAISQAAKTPASVAARPNQVSA